MEHGIGEAQTKSWRLRDKMAMQEYWIGCFGIQALQLYTSEREKERGEGRKREERKIERKVEGSA